MKLPSSFRSVFSSTQNRSSALAIVTGAALSIAMIGCTPTAQIGSAIGGNSRGTVHSGLTEVPSTPAEITTDATPSAQAPAHRQTLIPGWEVELPTDAQTTPTAASRSTAAPATTAWATPATPVILPLGTSAAPYPPVTMTDATPGALIYYEINGGAPIRYTGPFPVAVSETVAAIAVVIGGGSYAVSPLASQTYTVPVSNKPTWTQITTLPALLPSQGGRIIGAGDANLYALSIGGASPQLVNSIYIAPQGNLANWLNITSPVLSQNGSEYPTALGSTPNGTLFFAISNGAGVSDVFYWNGSTSAPAWTKVTGWTASSASGIYNFTNDSAGYTYFSPAWSGDIWRNDAPNSTNFTKLYSNLYGLTGSGVSGGLYQTYVWNLNDGKGDQIWSCGEGVLMNVDLAFSRATSYLNTAGFSGNCFGLAKGTNSIMALRMANANGDSLSRISIANRSTTVIPSVDPITPQHYPSYMDTNTVGGLQWLNGTNWMLNDSSHGIFYLLLSQDDGTTWTDITKSGAIDSSCTGYNVSSGSAATSHYIYARCQNGRVYWQYGPI